MLAKCTCNNCSGHLEFEAEEADQEIGCPHCGLRTTLFVPHVPLVPGNRWKTLTPTKLLILSVPTTVLVAALVYGTYEWGLTVIKEVAPGAASTLAGVVVMAIACLVIIWAVLWILFPVFVYFQLGKMIRLMEQIERNSRPAVPADKATSQFTSGHNL